MCQCSIRRTLLNDNILDIFYGCSIVEDNDIAYWKYLDVFYGCSMVEDNDMTYW